jgi:Xaa-Pro aminopeptidase
MTTGPPDRYLSRLRRLREAAGGAGLDALAVFSERSIAYLTGVDQHGFGRLFVAVVPAEGPVELIVPELDSGRVEASDWLLPLPYGDGAGEGMAMLRRSLERRARVGVDDDQITLADALAIGYPGQPLIPVGELLRKLRSEKDEDEVEAIRDAAKVVHRAILDAFECFGPGATEIEIAAWVENTLKLAGSTETHVVALAGPNSALPHGAPSSRPLAAGDLLIIDAAARIGGYFADLCRCAAVAARPDWATEAWSAVVSAQRAAVARVVAGVECQAVDRAARSIIDPVAARLGGSFPHGSGHGIGLEIHEAPFLRTGVEEPVPVGAVVSVEPGIYLPGIGGMRLEDDVLATLEGPVLLNPDDDELYLIS